MSSAQDTRGMVVRLSKRQKTDVQIWQRQSGIKPLAARRARIIELLADGHPQCAVAAATGAGIASVGRARRRFLEDGLEAAVFGYVAPGASRLLNANQEASIVALVCSDPPKGRCRWTVALLAEEAVRRGAVKRVGRETIRLVLKNHGLKPWREKNVVRAPVDDGVQAAHGEPFGALRAAVHGS